MKTTPSLEEQWNNVRTNYEDGNIDKETLLYLIEDIDNELSWEELEPWWRSMNAYRKEIMKGFKPIELLHNSIQCPDGTILVSRHQHDFVEHAQSDGRRYFIDGGLDYQRIGSTDKDFTKLTCYSSDNHKKIRELFEWGRRYDADMNPIPLEYIKLKDIADDHLIALVRWTENDYPKKINRVFKDEVEWRKL